MVYPMDTLIEVTKIPHQDTFNTIKSRLSEIEICEIKDAINEKIDSSLDTIHTAGWIPGKIWNNTPYQIIYDKAAKQNYDVARKMFGLLVFIVFMERDDKWIFGNFENNGEPIGSKTYFRYLEQRVG